ncbi:MAG: DinB family protein [Blastocatellia bacterium]|nr:DinB family protein [Blastocatellia bacterium]
MDPGSLEMLFGYNHLTLHENIAGLSHTDSLLQPHPGGNCLNWVLGHIVATRNQVLKLLGKEPILNEEEAALYKRGSAPIKDGSRALLLEKLLADLDLSQELIVAGLKEASEEDLMAPAGTETVGRQLALLHFHEAYHAGQIGLLRRLAGKEGAIK